MGSACRVLITRHLGHVLVACATPPVHGSDGSIEYSVDLDKRAGRLLPDGSIDLRERNSAVAVTTGQIVARVTGSTVGEDGCDVRGAPLAATPGTDPDVTAGEEVRLEESEDQSAALIAEIDGNLAVESGTVHVRSVFTVSGDVDYDVGNIDVPGDVEIRGLVGSGFSVAGTTEPGATLQAGGDGLVGQGILGEKTCVIADGSVTTKFIQDSVVTAGGDITVGSYIFNGRVSAGTGRARRESGGGDRGGSIVGGQVLAGHLVEAHRIGSSETDRTLVGMRRSRSGSAGDASAPGAIRS
ncbi:MAG: FapA family protein [Candidatus Latescibacterota bacterium]